MIRWIAAFACLACSAAPLTTALAGPREDIAQCRGIADNTARLACYDAIVPAGSDASGALSNGEKRELAEALRREFRFDPGLQTGPFSFRIAVSGDLQTSRDTAAAREVERIVRRVARAFGDFDGWHTVVTVHGAETSFNRGSPYSGSELLRQAKAGLARSDLADTRYTVEEGAPAKPLLWDDGRMRGANEHIVVTITGVD